MAEWTKQIGNVPLVIAGDWNDHWHNHLPVRDLIDLELMESQLRKATYGGQTVLDHALLSPHLMQKITKAVTSDISFPVDHCALEFAFDCEPSDIAHWPRLRYAKNLQESAARPYPGELQMVEHHNQAYDQALSSGCLDAQGEQPGAVARGRDQPPLYSAC